MSKLQLNPTIFSKVIHHFVHGQLLSRPFPIGLTIVVSNCIKIHSYEYFFQDHLGSFKTIPLFSIFTAQWQDSSFSSHPHSTGPPRTSRWPLGSGRVMSPSTLEASNIPRERWYASIIGFLGTKGFKRWQHLNISKDVEARKTPEDIFTAFTNTLEVSTSQWNYIDEMYSDI